MLHIGAFAKQFLPLKISKCTYSQYVYAALLIQHAKRLRQIAICSPAGSKFLFHISHKQ